MKIVLTGATGFIGVPLVDALRARGDELTVLVRDVAKAKALDARAVAADLQSLGAWTETLAGVDAVVHLAGEPVTASRWDARQKQVLRDSRVETTRTIVEAIAALPAEARPRALITASGTDYYPFAPDTEFDDDEYVETDAPGESFLARLCRDWEAEAVAAETLGVRVVRMRTGIVLGPGGAVSKMATPFKLFAGGRIGAGRQWMPWIHRVDAVRAYTAAISDHRYAGPVNLVTKSTRNADFAKALGHALGRPSWLPVPGFALRAAVGEFAEYLLKGRNVVARQLHALGFAWEHSTLAGAMAASL